MTVISKLNFTISVPAQISTIFSLDPQRFRNALSQTAISSTSVANPSFVDASIVTEWLRKFNIVFPQFERSLDNCIYPLLEKGVQDITPLIHEGQLISNSPTHCQGISQTINDLVKPRMLQLQKAFTQAQKKLLDNKSVKEEDFKLAKKWEKLGLPASILENYADCARFLIESGLAFQIVGFRETSQNPNMHDVKLDHDGQPMIKVQGAFKRWEIIKQELIYDPQTYQIRSRQYYGSIAQNWTYLSPQGLVPIDRLNHERLVPIYQLSPGERQRVVNHARKFYETNPEVDPGIPKDWVVQFHTSPRRQFVASMPPLPDNPLYDNLARNLNTHIVMRLIAPNGDVYSFGVEMPAESQEFLWEGNMAKFLGTVNATINKAGDYEEFRPHVGRIVTSIPLTNQRAQNILTMLNGMGDIRFNFLRQNCANLVSIILKNAGYNLQTQTTVSEAFYDALPDAKHIPMIGPVLHLIQQCYKKIMDGVYWITPKPIQNAIILVKDMIAYLPCKVGIIFLNLFILKFGGGKKLHSLPDSVPEDDLFIANRFLNFSTLIRSWTDLFKDEISEVYHSKYFIDWQKNQPSTFIEPYSGRPKLTIVPPAVV